MTLSAAGTKAGLCLNPVFQVWKHSEEVGKREKRSDFFGLLPESFLTGCVPALQGGFSDYVHREGFPGYVSVPTSRLAFKVTAHGNTSRNPERRNGSICIFTPVRRFGGGA